MSDSKLQTAACAGRILKIRHSIERASDVEYSTFDRRASDVEYSRHSIRRESDVENSRHFITKYVKWYI